MSENEPRGWVAPGGQQPARPPVQPPAPQQPATPQPAPPTGAPAQFPQPQYPQPQYQPPAFGGPPPGWAPPPRPGLVPLRPLQVGDILGAAFRVFRRNPRTTFGTSLLFQAASFVISVAIAAGVGYGAFSAYQGALPQDRSAAVPGILTGALGALLVPLVLTIGVSSILQGLFVLETSRQVVGEKLRLPALLRQARGRIGVLVGWTVLLIAAAAVFVGIVFGVAILLAVVGGTGGGIAAVVIGVFGWLGTIVLAAFVLTKTSLVPSVLVLERLTLRRAIGRSWRLTRRSFWRTFGIIALVLVIVQVASSVASTPLSFLGQIGGGLLSPNGSVDTSNLTPLIVASVATQAVNVIFSAIGAVIEAATVALLYIDLRIRREGLDLELVRYVELRSQGAAPLPNPYRSPGT